MAKSFVDVLNTLDFLPRYSNVFRARLQYMDLAFLVGRYYIAIHSILYPVAIDSDEFPTQRVFLEPVTTIYIQENRVLAYVRHDGRLDVLSGNEFGRAPVISLSENENLLALAATAIADKVIASPSEKNILRVLPSNLRTYVEIAMESLKTGSSNVLGKTIQKQDAEAFGKKLLEYVLWIGKANYDVVKEVDYVFGVTMRTLRIKHQSFDVEIKSYSKTGFVEALNVIEKLLSINIVSSIIRNVERSFKILTTASNLL